jgi:hypothetical protein
MPVNLDRAEEERKDKAGEEQNDFINQRLTWLGTFEGLLFVADHYGSNPRLLPVIGAALATSVWIGTCAANRELTKLNRQAFQDSRYLWPLRYLTPGAAIPVIIIVAWLVLLFERVCHHS